MKKGLGVMLTIGALAAAPAFAQNPGSQGTTRPQGSPAGGSKQPAGSGTQATAAKSAGPADTAFAKEAAVGGMAEVELGNLAKSNGSSPDVKQFGERMATDHGKANDELKQWAQQKNVTLPTTLDAKHKATRDRLSKLQGEAFDKAYMHEMVTDHQKDVAAFKRESTSGKDPDLKAWASKTLPTLQDHLKLSQDTASKVGAAGANTKTTAAKKSGASR
jgi:putative membrane protein